MSNIKSIKEIGSYQTYDLEIDHPDHQYYLSNGILTSNSHAVLYSMLSYHTAYLKAHFPIEFLLANLSAELNSNTPDAELNADKAKKELRQHGINILPPDINLSDMTFKLINDQTLITGLEALKFVGEDAIEEILVKRPFKNFHDFMLRCETKKMRANAIQALAASGALDTFKIPRRLLYIYCTDYRKKLQVWLKKHNPETENFEFPWVNDPEWTKPELYALEKHYLGEAFACSKREAFGEFFKGNKHFNLSQLKSCGDRTPLTSVKAEIKSIFEFKVKKVNSKYFGQEMLKVLIEDEFGVQAGLTIFPDRWRLIKQKVRSENKEFIPGFVIHLAGTSNLYDNEIGIILDNLYDILPPPPLPTDLKSKKKPLEEGAIEQKSSPLMEEIEAEIFGENFGEDLFSLDI